MSGPRRKPRPYYPNQRFKNWGQGGRGRGGRGAYNFSSDVDLGNPNGSFQYGASPAPPAHHHYHHQPYGGMGFSSQYHGGGGYNPQRYYQQQHGHGGGYRGGFHPQHHHHQQRFHHHRGGGRFFRGGRGRGYHHVQTWQRPQTQDGDDPYYHPSMFEDPWRFLMPKNKREDDVDRSEKIESENVETNAVESVTCRTDDGAGDEVDKKDTADTACVLGEDQKVDVLEGKDGEEDLRSSRVSGEEGAVGDAAPAVAVVEEEKVDGAGQNQEEQQVVEELGGNTGEVVEEKEPHSTEGTQC